MSNKLTEARVAKLQAGEVIWDASQPGFGTRRQQSAVSFILRDRFDGKQRLHTIGRWPALSVEKARSAAKIAAGDLAKGQDPAAEKRARRTAAGGTLENAIKDYLKRHVRKRLRAKDDIEAVFDRHVTPRLGGKPVREIRRSDVARMLDAVEEGSGPAAADKVLAVTRALFHWIAARSDDFNPPVVRGMRRTKTRDRSRTRILSDAELRALWTATEQAQPRVFGSLVRLLLLTGQRRDEAAALKWDEVDGKIWLIPGKRYKTKVEHLVPLSDAAAGVLSGLKRWGDYAFTTDGLSHFSGFSKAKARLDVAILAAMRADAAKAGQDVDKVKLDRWVLHDLRRTARSLMSRAGVDTHVADRVLGHAIPGVRGTYDRHAYTDEKVDALTRLAQLVERIIISDRKVVDLAARRQASWS